MFNLFINKAINENLYNEFIDFVKKVRNQGGNWAKEIIVDDNQYYYLTKAEINLVDDVDDYNIDCANEDENDSDYVKLEIEDKMKTYTNVEAVKKVIEAIEDFTYDKDFQRILSSLDMCFNDNITEKDMKSLIEQYSDEVEMKKDMKQREAENEKLATNTTRYFKTTWTWEDESVSQVILEVEDGKLVVMYDLTRNEEIHDFYDVDARIAVENCLKGLNQRLLEHEAKIYIKGNWLEKIILEEGMSQYEFAIKRGLERSTINRIINKNTPIEQMYISTAEAIAKGLGMTLVEFIEKYYKEVK